MSTTITFHHMLGSFTMLHMLSDRLKIARTRARLTQQQAADQIGVGRSAVAHWEGGSSKPDHENLVRAASVYNVAVEWLLDDTGEQPQGGAPVGSNGKQTCERSLMRMVAEGLYQTLERDGLVMEPGDFAALLLLLHDWASEETAAGRNPDIERIRWFVRVARSYRRQ